MVLLLLVCALHIVAGGIISRYYFQPRNRTEWFLTAGLLAYVTFTMVPIGLGWLTGYMNGWVLMSGGVAAGLLSLTVWYKGRVVSPQFAPFDASLFRKRNPVDLLIIVITIVVLGLLFMAGMALPVRTWDAPAYHMSNPVRWHMTGKFILDSFGGVELSPQMMSAETAPNAKAVWPFAVMLFTNNTSGTSLTQFPFLLLLVLAVRAIGLRIGTRPWLASLSAFAVITIPEVFLQSLEAYADLLFLAGQMVVVWSLLNMWQSNLSIKPLILLAIGIGILVGGKALGIVTGGALGILVLCLLSVKIYRAKQTSYYYLPAVIGLCIIAAAVTGGPWLVNAWQKFQNPFFPYELKIGSQEIFAGPLKPTLNTEMIKTYTGSEGFEAYWNTLRETGRPPSISNWSSGPGAGMFVVGIASAILFLLFGLVGNKGSSARRILVLSTVVLAVTCPTLAVPRFSLFQPVMGYIAFGWIATVIPIYLRVPSAVWVFMVFAYDLSMSASAIQYRQRPAELVAFNLLSGYPGAAERDIFPDQYTALDYWREEVSKSGTKVAVMNGMNVWWAYAPWSPGDVLRIRDEKNTANVSAWHDEMTGAGVTHLYVRYTDASFKIANARPDLFRLILHRLDGQYSISGEYFVEPWPEDALFEVVRPVAK